MYLLRARTSFTINETEAKRRRDVPSVAQRGRLRSEHTSGALELSLTRCQRGCGQKTVPPRTCLLFANCLLSEIFGTFSFESAVIPPPGCGRRPARCREHPGLPLAGAPSAQAHPLLAFCRPRLAPAQRRMQQARRKKTGHKTEIIHHI